MKSKQLVMVLVTLAVVFSTATHAFADCRKRVDLNTVGAGFAINASGDARVRQVGDRQKFTVEMDANIVKRTTFEVYANGQPAGTLTIVRGGGTFEISNSNGNELPAGVEPVCSITTVEVKDTSGNVVLSGSF